MSGDHNQNQTSAGWRKRQIALDKKAENARELGLDYEPEQKPMHQEMRKIWEDHFDKFFRDDQFSKCFCAQPAPSKTIIEMAREAGICTWLKPPSDVVERIERFAALVRADEREACAELVFNSPPSDEYESPLRAVYNAIRARGQA